MGESFPRKSHRVTKCPDGDTIGHGATTARKRSASHKLCGPAERRGKNEDDNFQTATGHDWAGLHEGNIKSRVCCPVSEVVVKGDPVILLVETYVLTVELNDKITEILQPAFNWFTV